jgi:kynurenine formamidase
MKKEGTVPASLAAKWIDLTLRAPDRQGGEATCRLEERRLMAGPLPYTAMIYHFRHDSMAGTYIDFPGHIKEADDGLDAVSYPLEGLYRVPAAVIHLDRASGSGRIGAAELAGACPRLDRPGALILNALGTRRFDEIAERSVYLGRDAVRWIADAGFHLLVSDVFESNTDPQQVFNTLFARRVSTVCHPVNLHRVDRPAARLTALPLCFAGATQLPCRVVAELETP